ncbi:MAG: PQQ-binding-like beta-propeller repeat protein [Planctomycetia bacterium]|nr:PQQ-binding-like beta-propeller repeat protein [Planctomycetia bacterium]
MKHLLLTVLLGGFLLADSLAADWPTYGGDASRTGYTADALPAKLSPRWEHHATHAPMPAWPRSDRQPFDRVAHPVIAGGLLFFGSSADGTIRALDTATGQSRWTYYTDAPVRFAPAVWKDRLFAVSDDGFLYCLNAADGKLLWKKRGGPDGRMILGNDRMVSCWPARGGPVVVEDRVYFGAGIWPSDGIYFYCLDAATGKELWLNDRSGSIYMGQPHGGANAHSGVSSQGYLLAHGDQLLMPTGRAVPASFKRTDGVFQYFHLQQYGHKGGTTTLATGDHFINGGLLFDLKTGNSLDVVGPGVVAASPEGVATSTLKGVTFSKFADKERKDKKGETIKYRGLDKVWTVADAPGGTAVIIAGQHVISAGGKQVVAIDRKSQARVWSTQVDGNAHGLAVADGKLFVSTDAGTIYCFDGTNAAQPAVIRAATQAAPYGENSVCATAALEILRKADFTEGYCVDLGCGDGALAYELAVRSKLQIYCVDNDPANVALARQKLSAAGLYGVRVVVHQADPAKTPYPKYFANLVVSGRSVTAGPDAAPKDEVLRLQRPYGGVAVLGKVTSMQRTERGALAGAGNWTHQYADPANTCCSADTHVKGKLSMFWYRDSDFDMPQRHGRGPAPLYLDGRLFVEGLNGLRAVDAYNGRTLWEFPLDGILKPYNGEHLMGTAGTNSNYCVTPDGVYVRTGDRCLRLDVATGRKLAEFTAPKLPNGKKGVWGYIACENGSLFGSVVNEEHVVKWSYQKADMGALFTESALFFALDAVRGTEQWTFKPKNSIRHNAIAIGAGKVFLIDRPMAEMDRFGLDKTKEISREHGKGELLALDAATGKTVWKSDDNIYGTLLALSVKHDALLMSYQPTAFRLPSEKGGQLSGFRASDGKRLWDQKASYTSRPVINDATIYALGGSWDIRTGEERSFKFKKSYGCGQLASSAHLMVFRSATLGYVDVKVSERVEDYGGIRPGCWINAIPAGGVVLVPDASAGCQCSYLNQAWIALQAIE